MWIFNIHSVAKLQKIEGGPLVEKNSKVAQCRKKLKRRKRKNLFGSVPWANRCNLKFCRTILVTSGVSKKTLTKNHDTIVDTFQEKRRLKTRPSTLSLFHAACLEACRFEFDIHFLRIVKNEMNS